MPKHHLALLTVALTAAVAGCGSRDTGTSEPVQVGSTINYSSVGTTADIDCGDGKSLNVGGSNNTLRVTGTCASVSVGGADNRITLERVDVAVSVVGLNNIVSYKAGDPAVDDEGSGNRIARG